MSRDGLEELVMLMLGVLFQKDYHVVSYANAFCASLFASKA